MQQKIGLFGGTFNPIHHGHLAMAQAFFQELRLDKVIFLPTGDSYHKTTTAVAAHHRLNMTQLAVEPYPYFSVSDEDVRRQGATYTYDTVEIFKQRYPQAQLWWLMGSDSLLQLHTWHRWQDLVNMTHIAVAMRSEQNLTQVPESLRIWLSRALVEGSVYVLNMPQYPISSTNIREKLAKGENASAWLPESVQSYIVQQGLYQTAPRPMLNQPI